MGRWFKGMKHLLGIRLRSLPDEDPERLAVEIRERAETIAERERARRRVEALDMRVDVLSGRMTRHEQKERH